MEANNNEFITNIEQIQLNEIKHSYQHVLKQRIETHVLEASVKGFVTAEPVKFEDRLNYPLRDFKKGESWGKLFECAWFNLTGTIPNYSVDTTYQLKLDVSGEALLVDDFGNPVKGFTNGSSAFDRKLGEPGKLFHPINDFINKDGSFSLWIEAGANDLFGNLSDEGRLLAFDIVLIDEEKLSLYYDMETMDSILSMKAKHDDESIEIKTALLEAAYLIMYEPNNYVKQAKHTLSKLMKPNKDGFYIDAVGHAHMDLAWLWPIRETRRKVGRTIANIIDILNNHKDFIFGVSQPQMIQWLKEDYPTLYETFKSYVMQGRIELQGGMWVESDTNLAGEEALVRQMLYGIEFYKEEFGFRVKNLWLPDVFGYSGNMPQIIKKSGLDYFMTIKISWNLHNRFPHHSFHWVGIDGSSVLAHMPPEGTYNSAALPKSHIQAKNNYIEMDKAPLLLSVYGIGNGGGGPGYEHINRIDRQINLIYTPKVRYNRADNFFNKLIKYEHRLPQYTGELYLENHQGTYTSQSNIKRYNRLLEKQLKSLETYLSLSGQYEQHKESIDTIWKEVLLYQFHDILPGTSIRRVNVEAEERYKKLSNDITNLMNNGQQSNKLFNPLMQEVEIVLKADNTYNFYKIAPLASSKPLISYKKEKDIALNKFNVSNYELILNKETGVWTSLKYKGKELLSQAAGNLLMVYKDFGDAWNIMEHYRIHPEQTMQLTSYRSYQYGPLTEIVLTYTFKESTLTETLLLNPDTDTIEIKHEVDWKNLGYMLRSSFPLNAQTDIATFDIQFGHITRKRTNDNAQEKAQFEMCGLQWVEIKDDVSFAILNKGKNGYYIKDGLLDINLLRSTNYPSVNGDIGKYTYDYAITLGSKDLIELDQRAEVYNTAWMTVDQLVNYEAPLRFNNQAIVYSTIKKSYDNKDLIVRLYNRSSKNQHLNFDMDKQFKKIELTNLVEEKIEVLQSNELEFSPFEVKTLRFIK